MPTAMAHRRSTSSTSLTSRAALKVRSSCIRINTCMSGVIGSSITRIEIAVDGTVALSSLLQWTITVARSPVARRIDNIKSDAIVELPSRSHPRIVNQRKCCDAIFTDARFSTRTKYCGLHDCHHQQQASCLHKYLHFLSFRQRTMVLKTKTVVFLGFCSHGKIHRHNDQYHTDVYKQKPK